MISVTPQASFRSSEAENFIDAIILSNGSLARASVQSLGCALTVAAQRERDRSRNLPIRCEISSDQLEQSARGKALEDFILDSDDRLVTARIALSAGRVKYTGANKTISAQGGVPLDMPFQMLKASATGFNVGTVAFQSSAA